MFRTFFLVTLLAAVGLLFASSQPDAEGCAAVRRPDGPSISIAEESAIIVWDPVKKVQHFIRRAAFDTKSPDFGFLVPTPTQPILAEVKDDIFREVDKWILPRIVEETRISYFPIMCSITSLGTNANKTFTSVGSSIGSVRILHEQKVGGFNVKVLEADDTESLGQWLREHGYAKNPELESWLAPYVAAKWKISAFKIIQDPKTGHLEITSPVRMSFKTDRPFFPYREPADKEEKPASSPSRLLRVFFVSDGRVEGKLGNAAPWQARVPWSDQLTEEQRKAVAKETGVAETDIPAQAWMTTFEDPSSPRPGKDEVFFDPAPDRSPIRPPDIIIYKTILIPADLLIGILFVLVMGVKILRDRRFEKHKPPSKIPPHS